METVQKALKFFGDNQWLLFVAGSVFGFFVTNTLKFSVWCYKVLGDHFHRRQIEKECVNYRNQYESMVEANKNLSEINKNLKREIIARDEVFVAHGQTFVRSDADPKFPLCAVCLAKHDIRIRMVTFCNQDGHTDQIATGFTCQDPQCEHDFTLNDKELAWYESQGHVFDRENPTIEHY